MKMESFGSSDQFYRYYWFVTKVRDAQEAHVCNLISMSGETKHDNKPNVVGLKER